MAWKYECYLFVELQDSMEVTFQESAERIVFFELVDYYGVFAVDEIMVVRQQ